MEKEIKELTGFHSYDITEIAKENRSYNHCYKVYMSVDVWDCHIYTIQKDINKEFEGEEGKYLVEMMDVKLPRKANPVLCIEEIKRLLEENDFSNEDYGDYDSLEEAIDDIGDGFDIKQLEYINNN